ncbi:MAG: YDG domain-containing protein, partial [Rhodoferax sp.]
TQSVGSYASKNVGSGILVTANLASTDFSPTGQTILTNYTLPTSVSGNIGSITPASVSVSGVTAASKVYDGSIAATLSGGRLAGVLAGDSVALGTLSGSFADKNVGTAKVVTVSGLTLGGTDAGNYVLGTSSLAASADITPKTLGVSAITAASRVYDGTTLASVSGGSLSGAIAGDAVALVAPTGNFADPNVGVAKPVTLSGLALSGADAANYALPAVAPAVAADITVRPLSTWTGAVSNLWSDPKNWDALPVGSNVLAVSIPAGAVVVRDTSAAPATLQSIDSGGVMNVSGGSLTVSSALSTAQYTQTGGSVTGSGSLAVTNSFSQSAGSIALGGPVSITQAQGDLTVGAISASGISLAAPNGGIFQTDAQVTGGVLAVNSAKGALLNNAGNRVAAFSASSSGAGNIELTNVGAINVLGINAANGNVRLFNTGGISTSGAVVATNGSVSMTANSPLTVGAGGISANGDIALTATNLTSSGNMAINGDLNSATGGIALNAANDFTQNAVMRAAQG